MNRTLFGLTTICAWCVLVIHASGQGPALVIDQIPHDARGFVLVPNLAATADKMDALAARLQAPVPKLGALLATIEKGLDQEREVALAWLGQREDDEALSAYTHFVLYLPVSDYGAFLAQFGLEDSGARIADATLNDQQLVIAKKAGFALIAQGDDRDSLDHVLNADRSIAEIAKPLQGWMHQNDLTISLSPSGTGLLFAKLREGLELIKAGAAAAAQGNAEANADVVAAALDVYRAMFDAGEKEVMQLALGLRITPEQSIELHKRVLLAPEGSWATASANLQKPEHPFSGLPGGPFVIAFDGALPKEWPRAMMAMSLNMLQSMSGTNAKEITAEQLDRISDVVAKSMQGVRSMSFAMGVGAGDGMYSHTAGIFRVDDAKSFMTRYENAITEMSKLMEAVVSGSYQVERVQMGDLSVLRVVTDMSKFQFGNAPGVPNAKEAYGKLFGSDGKLSIYLAPADDHAIVMAYTSEENLLRALTAYRAAGNSGLSNETGFQTTAKLLPTSAQWVGYLSLAGTMQFSAQMAGVFAPGAQVKLPEFPASPPLGFSAELTPTHLDARFVVPLETIDAVKKFVELVQQSNAANAVAP